MGFSGLADVQGVRAEGVAMGADALASAISSANAQAEEPVRAVGRRGRDSFHEERRAARVDAASMLGMLYHLIGDFPG